MSKFQDFQTRHLELVVRYEQDQSSKDLLADVQNYVEQVGLAGKEISNSRERNQLQGNLRFWGAFIYDQTGTYPNMNLLPSEAGTSVSATKPKTMKFGRIIIASLFLLAIIVLIGLKILLPRTGASNPLEPFPITANSMSMVEELATGTAKALTQSANSATATVTATSTATALSTQINTPEPISIPQTGGGGDLMIFGHAYSSIEIHEDVSCSNQRINIKMIHGFSTDQSVEPAILTISEEGTFRIIAERQIPLQAGELRENGTVEINTEINISDANGSYLIYIYHPKFTFDSVIIQHLPDCHGNLTDITYGIPSGDYDQIESRPNLDVKFNLMAWGPDPTSDYPDYYGVAKIHINRNGNATDHIFWISKGSENYEPIQNDEFIAFNYTDYYIGITSGGRTISIPFKLETPYLNYLQN